MLKDHEKEKRQLMEEIRFLRSKLAKLEPVDAEKAKKKEKPAKVERLHKKVLEDIRSGKAMEVQKIGEETARMVHELEEQRAELRHQNEEIQEMHEELEESHREMAIDVAARKRAEQEVLDSEERLQAALDAAGLGVWDWDIVGGRIAWEGCLEKLFGYKPGQFDGSYEMFERRVHPEDVAVLRAAIGRARYEKQEYQNEHRVIWPDGSIHWIQSRGRCYYDDKGDAVRMLGVVKDITERKEAQEALFQSEARFKIIFESIAEAAVFVDTERRIRVINSAAEKLWGYTGDELRGKTTECLHLNRQDYEELGRRHFHTGKAAESSTFEMHYRRRDGSIFLAESIGTQVRDSKGNVFGFVGLHRDITDRKRAENALQESEERFRGALENIPDVIVIYDADLRIRYVNAAMRQVTGKETSYFIGKRDDEIWPRDVYEAYLPVLRETFSTGTIHSLEADITLPDTGYHYLRITCVPILDEQGAVREIVGITNDLTGRKLAEKALMESQIRFRELFESMGSGVAVYEAVGNGENFVFKDLNRAGERIDKIGRKEVIGKKVTDLFPGIKEIGLFEIFQRVWRTGQPERHPVTHYQNGRLNHWVENYVYKLPGGELVSVYNDVTERKNIEEQLRDYYTKLRAMAISSLLTEEHQRHDIAQKLHDDIGHKLAMAKFSVESSMNRDKELIGREFGEALIGEIDSMIERVRSLTFELGNPVLTELGLEAALERHLTREVKAKYGINFELNKCGLMEISENFTICLFRSVRELLNNCVKHSGAKNVIVCIEKNESDLIITVEDDGKGFDVNEANSRIGKGGTFGLFSIQEQLESFGGRLKIKSVIGQGSRFEIVVPVDETK